ncbi:hypothetical protein P3S67_022522 [Capsicum chacoense]
MDWLLSPTTHMIELVPSKQSGSKGQRLEILTPKARADIHMNLPALQKLDSMLLETLHSMLNTEIWYTEVSSRAEGKNTKVKSSFTQGRILYVGRPSNKLIQRHQRRNSYLCQ